LLLLALGGAVYTESRKKKPLLPAFKPEPKPEPKSQPVQVKPQPAKKGKK